MSMSVKLFLFAVTFWILGNIICNVTSGATITQAQIDDVSALKQPISASFFDNVGKCLTWDYSIFNNPDGTTSDWAYIKYIFLYPLTAAVIIPIALMLFTAAASVVGSILKH